MNEETDRFYSILDGGRHDHKMSAAYSTVYIADSSGVCGARVQPLLQMLIQNILSTHILPPPNC